MPRGTVRVVSDVQTWDDFLTLQEAKDYIRVQVDTTDDARLTTMIRAAIKLAEDYLDKDILSREREQQIVEDTSNDNTIELYYSPVDEVTNVAIDGDTQTEDEGYEVQGAHNEYVKLLSSGNEKIAIQYTTEGLVGNEIIKQAVLMIVEDLYKIGEVSNGFMSLLSTQQNDTL